MTRPLCAALAGFLISLPHPKADPWYHVISDKTISWPVTEIADFQFLSDGHSVRVRTRPAAPARKLGEPAYEIDDAQDYGQQAPGPGFHSTNMSAGNPAGPLLWSDRGSPAGSGGIILTNTAAPHTNRLDSLDDSGTTNDYVFDQRRGTLWINSDYPRLATLLTNRWTIGDLLIPGTAGSTNYTFFPPNPAGPVGLPLQVLDRWVTTNHFVIPIESMVPVRGAVHTVQAWSFGWVVVEDTLTTNYSVGFRNGTNAVELWRTTK